jgi:hypothetical protein
MVNWPKDRQVHKTVSDVNQNCNFMWKNVNIQNIDELEAYKATPVPFQTSQNDMIICGSTHLLSQRFCIKYSIFLVNNFNSYS